MSAKPAFMCAIALTFATPTLAQTQGTAPATTLPGVAAPQTGVAAPSAAPLPGVTDPMATNSTTGTVDREDRCQPPGASANSNPSANIPALPRAEPACN